MDPHVVPPVHPCTLGPQSGTSRRWWSRMRSKSKSDHRSMSVSWALGRWYFIGWICQRDIPKIFTFSLVIALPRRNSMQNLMAIRISFRLLVNGVPHGKNKATIKLVDVYVLDVFAVFEQCVRAWLHFQSASVRRTIQDTNCGFNLTSNIKNMRLGVKNSQCVHATCTPVPTHIASCVWPAPNYDARSHWQVSQALRGQRWWRSHVLRNSQRWHGKRVGWKHKLVLWLQ